MNCPHCGSPIEPATAFCPNCGSHLSNIPPQRPVTAVPAEYKPMSPWGYIGWSVLFALPVVGFVLLIVMSFNSSNLNRRNYARSYWCAILIVILLLVAVSVIAAVTGTTEELITGMEQYLNGLSGM